MTKDEKIAKLGKVITDRATVLLGKDKITPDSPEYLGINSALKFTALKYDQKMADDILDIALTMKKRVPLTIEQLAKKNPQFDRAYLEKAMQAISESGLVEFHWENLDGKNPNHEKRWVLDMFVPGSAEIMMINPEQSDMFPETADFFERMAYLPLAGITEMVPPGGAGIGMHVIPVEKAIPAESKSLPIEHLSHWLKKYEGHIGVSVCSCRKQQRIRGEGSGDVEGEWCIGVGDFADYCRETNHGHDITYEEAMEILQKAEDRGYVHQITNIDGENKIFGICNCAVGVCNALRTSQLFNTPNLSASAYVAESDPDKCVACGKCVETCPAGAVRLGQKLCTKEGPIQYPRHELPDDTKWGEDHWNKNYRNENAGIADGVVINNSWAPKAILGEGGKVTGIELMRCVSVRDASGKFAPVYDENETITVPCSNVLVAIGQRSVYGDVLAGTAAETADGRLIAHDAVTFQSNEPDIFVGGDCATGPKYTIDAIATGREGAVSIHRFVNKGQTLTIHRNTREFKELNKDDIVLPTEKIKKPARAAVAIDSKKVRTMQDDRVTFTEEQIRSEASRCLSCGRSVVDPNKCIGCGICTTKCEFDAIHLKRVRPQNSKMIPAEDKFKAIAPYAAKRQVKIIKKSLTDKK